MNLPKKELLKGCKDLKGMEGIVAQAEKVLNTWQPIWSEFIPAPLREEALRKFSTLCELNWHAYGGHPAAERQRLLCSREENKTIFQEVEKQAPIAGLLIKGNFLFDNPTSKDFRASLENMGCPPGELGDIWVIGDRGAQAICTPEAGVMLHQKIGMIRDVQISFEGVELEQLSLPSKRLSKKLTTIEASLRVDSIASAGFGLSRGKIVNQIKAGSLRLNWNPIKQPSQNVEIGDRLQLDGRGTVEVLCFETTKRQRWRVELLRN
ncbi:photosystem II S4 domain protein [Prochlorococcus sp. MIT 1300]|uniref:photosystem II S4 domain protein n=1 Tax=Prochlorococcus sp. MIT 1300 TaxID=3096218 RepID=UPI002A75D529|nr:photosystem II S4 domain protein [Prochlorococcus sp. MIT 1300]